MKDVDACRVKHAAALWKMGFVPAVVRRPMTAPVSPKSSNYPKLLKISFGFFRLDIAYGGGLFSLFQDYCIFLIVLSTKTIFDS